MRISVIFLALTVSQLTSLHAKGLASPIHDSEEAGIRDDGLNEDPDEQPDLEERREAAEAQRAEAEERRQAEAEERSQQLEEKRLEAEAAREAQQELEAERAATREAEAIERLDTQED